MTTTPVYTYTYYGPSGGFNTQGLPAEISEVAQFSLSAPLAPNAIVWWSSPGYGGGDPFPATWLGGTISLVGAGTPANYSVPVVEFSANTNAAGQIIDWFIFGNVYLPGNIYAPGNTQEQAYSINSLAGTPPGVNPGAFDYDQATIGVVGSIGTFSWIFNPSGSVPGDWTETVTTPLPTITITQKLANDTGFSNTDLITSDGHVTLSGTVSDGTGVAGVEVFDGKVDLGPATISNGAWMFSTLLSEGTHSLYAVATDNVGNTTTTPTQPTIVVDTTPPTPFMSDAIKNSNNSLTTLSGMSEANSTVSVFDGTKPLGTVTADSSGNWSLQANISGGTHQFTETSTDVAGNTGYSAGVTVYSPGGNKTLTGGSGNDFLIAGKNDTLIGGAGNDTFVFNPSFGKETVADFNVNQDQLSFNHALFAQATAAFVLSQTHDTSFGAQIVVDPHDTITLPGVTTAQLAANPSDIRFF